MPYGSKRVYAAYPDMPRARYRLRPRAVCIRCRRRRVLANWLRLCGHCTDIAARARYYANRREPNYEERPHNYGGPYFGAL